MTSRAGQPIRIRPPSCVTQGAVARVEFAVEGLDPGLLWFELESRFANFLDDTCDAALVGILAPAMHSGAALHVDGTISARLRWSIRNTVMPVLERIVPGARAVEVVAPSVRRGAQPSGSSVLMGLSCGIDSFAACLDHLLDARTDAEERVTHFLFNDVGSHGPGGGDAVANLRAARLRNVAAVAATLGVPLLKVRSNLDAFYPRPVRELAFVSTHTLRNAAVALLLQAGARRLLYASATPWRRTGIRAGNMDTADPILVPALSTERIDLLSVGREYTRVQKTARIADWPLAQAHLNVCVESGVNCGRCFKCLRTLLTLELLGKLDLFAAVFDLADYRRRRERYVLEVLADRRDPLMGEVRELVRAVGYRPGVKLRVSSWLLRGARALPIPAAAREPIRAAARAALAVPGLGDLLQWVIPAGAV